MTCIKIARASKTLRPTAVSSVAGFRCRLPLGRWLGPESLATWRGPRSLIVRPCEYGSLLFFSWFPADQIHRELPQVAYGSTFMLPLRPLRQQPRSESKSWTLLVHSRRPQPAPPLRGLCGIQDCSRSNSFSGIPPFATSSIPWLHSKPRRYAALLRLRKQSPVTGAVVCVARVLSNMHTQAILDPAATCVSLCSLNISLRPGRHTAAFALSRSSDCGSPRTACR